jgi:integrase
LNVALALFLTFEKGVDQMGKNLKGKECGKGICQRKDDSLHNLLTPRHIFQGDPEAQNWLEEAGFAYKHDPFFLASEITVDQ